MRGAVADAEEIPCASADQAGEKIASLRTGLQESLKAAQGRVAETEPTVADKTSEAIGDVVRKASAAARRAADTALETIMGMARQAKDAISK